MLIQDEVLRKSWKVRNRLHPSFFFELRTATRMVGNSESGTDAIGKSVLLWMVDVSTR